MRHVIEGVVINTRHEFPPIPDRSFDWCATDDNYEPGCPIGLGATELDAIVDLLDQLEDTRAPLIQITCEACGGEGQFEVPLPFSRWTDDPHGCRVEKCERCNGAGAFLCEAEGDR